MPQNAESKQGNVSQYCLNLEPRTLNPELKTRNSALQCSFLNNS